MTAVVPPIIPGASPDGPLASLIPAAQPLPLPVGAPRGRRAGLVYSLSRVDASGRLSALPLLARLRWQTSIRLAATVVGSSVVFVPDRHGVFALDPKRKVIVPLLLRRPCGLRTGDQALLVADLHENVLVVHPMAALDKIVLGYHSSLIGGGNDD
ncbi:hypothetical protein [Amycolatopsis sp. NPDC051903]|uniref:hypothetical protein n=1 Tax=Amycolatopsis sp. NPDC051903 TaxID=3363936 RepID=UPI0037BA6F1F